MILFKSGVSILAISFLLGLTGCSSSDEDDLQRWMAEQRSATKPRVVRLAEPTKFTPQPYTQESAVEPFNAQKLTQALKRESNQSTSNAALIATELARRDRKSVV